MSFRDEVDATPGLKDAMKPGMQALGGNSQKITVNPANKHYSAKLLPEQVLISSRHNLRRSKAVSASFR